MKDRTENEIVKSGEINRNVKLGRGGFAKSNLSRRPFNCCTPPRPFLQGRQTLPTLQKLVQYNFLEPVEAAKLEKAYLFLRDVEHRVQMESNLQTHTIPSEEKARERLARLMGFKSAAGFEKRGPHTRATCARYMSDF